MCDALRFMVEFVLSSALATFPWRLCCRSDGGFLFGAAWRNRLSFVLRGAAEVGLESKNCSGRAGIAEALPQNVRTMHVSIHYVSYHFQGI